VTTFDVGAFDPPLRLPVLESGPAVLRPFEAQDVGLVQAASHDPYIPNITSIARDASDADAQRFIRRQQELATGGHGYSLAIASANDGAGVGAVGLWLRDIEQGRATAGYWVVASARGAGLAGWALRGLVAFAFERLAIPRLQLYIEPWNTPSVRTAAFAGFTYEAHLRGWEHIDGAQHDADCYSLLRTEWHAQ
jgi:RimJ/RimL family protein N-acetyltransferase